MKNQNFRIALGAMATFLAASFSLPADVKLPAIFGDHMVLQEGMKLPVWGTASPGEAVTVTVGAETASAKADVDGKWRVELPALAETAAPVTLTVHGNNTLTFTDVLVGEVWICSGQSNMEFPLVAHGGFGGDPNAATVAPQAKDPQLRFFRVTHVTALEPRADVVGKWELCTPESASFFSAVAYFFGKELRADLRRPVGLIGTYWGGTPAQAWTSISGLDKDPELQHFVESHKRIAAAFPQLTATLPARQADYKAKFADWQKSPDGVAYDAAMTSWKADCDKAKQAGQPYPPKPVIPPGLPTAPMAPDGGQNMPANLYNGMIAPLIPFAVKGAIWYQGESNANFPVEYRTLFVRMITDWREQWGEGDFPFLFVQLAGFHGPAKDGIESWPILRESQAKTLSLPKTGMATAVDIGAPTNIHPADKSDVGDRLALAARHIAYDEKVVDSGPVYNAMAVQGNSIHITFAQEGGGLIIGQAPWVAPSSQPLPTDKLLGFSIAGDDKKWVPADAKIAGDAVVVSSPDVANPTAVRYDWDSVPDGNLYNKEMLPAPPFRTDEETLSYPPPARPAPAATAAK